MSKYLRALVFSPALWWGMVWLISRSLMYRTLLNTEFQIIADVNYYFAQTLEHGADGGLVEYPTPVAWGLSALRLAAGDDKLVFVQYFMALMMVLDFLVTIYLWASRARVAACYWGLFTFLIGPLCWVRLDLLSAVPVALAMIWLTRHPRSSGAMIAIGAATKLWPAILIAPALGRTPAALRRGQGFLLLGAVLGLASLVFYGWERSISPLTWQSERGLQIESVPATWLMLQRVIDPSAEISVRYSEFNAYQIYGPEVETWMGTSDNLMIFTIILSAILFWAIGAHCWGLPANWWPRRSWNQARLRLGPAELELNQTAAIIAATMAITAWMIVANKTFSPQYMIWLAGPLALLLSLPLSDWGRLASYAIGGIGILAALLTHLVYPTWYGGLIGFNSFTDLATSALVSRNCLVIVVAIGATLMAICLGLGIGSLGAGSNGNQVARKGKEAKNPLA